MNTKEFWEKLSIEPSNNDRDMLLIFDERVIAKGSSMAMKMKGDELLKQMVEKGEVIL
jgi:hypothetical protein